MNINSMAVWLKSLVFLCLCISGCGGCDNNAKPPPPTPGKELGESCLGTDECQDGLECAQQFCVHRRCTQSADPQGTCALKLAMARDTVVCRTDGTCSIKESEIGDPCQMDSTCVFGSVCEQEVCVETCVSNASCQVDGDSCLPRASNPQQKVCQTTTCAAQALPSAYCAQQLGTRAGGAMCEDDVCVRVDLPLGSTCILDGECARNAICVDNACVLNCWSNPLLCSGDEQCIVRQGGVDAYCKVVDVPCTSKENPTDYCQTKLDDIYALCLPTGHCIGGYAKNDLPYILIQDVSQDCHASAHGVGAPGSDLTFLRLYDRNQNLRGYGLLRALTPSDMPMAMNGYTLLPDGLNGVPDQVEQGLCPAQDQNTGRYFTAGRVWSMGCHTTARFAFVDLSGKPLLINEGDIALIGEYDNSCGVEENLTDPDKYMVTLCQCVCEDRCDDECLSCGFLPPEQHLGISEIRLSTGETF